MRIGRSATLLTIGVLTAAGLPAGAASAAPPDTIYVSTSCGTNPDGSQQRPYCSIRAATDNVRPGQTIVVGPGQYNDSVSLPSGEPGKPITIKGFRGPTGRTTVGSSVNAPRFTLSGVHDVVIDGLNIAGGTGTAVVIEDSTDIVLTNGWLTSIGGPGVAISGDSRRVTISGMVSRAFRSSFVSVGAGVSDTLLSANSVEAYRSIPVADPAVVVTNAPRTTLTNNTIVTDCAKGVEVAGASTGFGLYNTIVRTQRVAVAGCGGTSPPDPASTPAVSVATTAVADSRLDYNVIDPIPGGPAYSWDGTMYSTPGAFHAATGQGAHDLGADAKLVNAPDVDDLGWSLSADSPAIDSAWSNAPGLPGMDLLGNAHADKPDAPNSGGGFVDRGAAELMPTLSYSNVTSRVRGGGPFDTDTTVTATSAWPVDGPVGTFVLKAMDQTVINRGGTQRFTFNRAGRSCVYVEASPDGFRSYPTRYTDSECLMLGAAFTAVAPQRVLSTKAAIGVSRTTPLNPHEEIELPLPAPVATANAVVLNVTVTNPTSNGYLKVYPSTEPVASNINFVANQTIPNLVTVPVANGKVKIKNGSAGTVHVLADLAGYYGSEGVGLTSNTPARVLDTRSAVGVPGDTPLGPNGRVTVDLAGRVPVGTTAVVLNVAVTKPTAGGHLTAFPPDSAVPTTSNLNFVTGQTANNMVIAPVVDRKISFAYGGSGTVHVLADLSGYFAPGIADTFLPVAPTRILDTRESFNPIGPGQAIWVSAYDNDCYQTGCRRTAVVANLTVTGAQSPGYLTVYPEGQPRPTASVINFGVNETIANQITVGLGPGFMVYNSSAKPVNIVVDMAGLYLAPPA
ncbi:right-handed parallel beta-helix repeat-containing protein [Asanoa sp. NPDC049518]|uniref:right-handed parallel beta-helix repeat-containing protein n=1 Tax=unclassified Asanoa TaxID=2685164 RepID=UPI0034419889